MQITGADSRDFKRELQMLQHNQDCGKHEDRGDMNMEKDMEQV